MRKSEFDRQLSEPCSTITFQAVGKGGDSGFGRLRLFARRRLYELDRRRGGVQSFVVCVGAGQAGGNSQRSAEWLRRLRSLPNLHIQRQTPVNNELAHPEANGKLVAPSIAILTPQILAERSGVKKFCALKNRTAGDDLD